MEPKATDEETVTSDEPQAADAAVEAGGDSPATVEDTSATAEDADTEDDDDDVVVEVEGDEGDDAEPSLEETLQQRIEELEAAKKDGFERLLRAKADLENFRKRSRRELDDARFEAKGRVLKEILPVVDNLERALTHAEANSAEGDESAKGILEGVKLVMRQFEQALEKCEVKAVEAVGKPFDPNFHEAMGQLETDEVEPGAVAQVLQTGYTLGARLLRPAMVVVAKRPPEPAAGPNGKSASADSEAKEESEAEADEGTDSEGAVEEVEATEEAASAEWPESDGGSDEQEES
jgi:molecular chaperone GrpE